MAVDESVSLPSPPPPRPTARQAAIEAALRRFDGEPATGGMRERPKRWWSDLHRRPVGGLVTAALIAVVSVPAAMIALRDQPTNEAPQPRITTRNEPARVQPNAAAEQADAGPPAAADHPAARTPMPLPLEPHTDDARQAPAEEHSAEPVARIAAAAPPPPPPPPPAAAPSPPAPPAPAAAEQVADTSAGSQEIVLTGSRVRRPDLEKPSNIAVMAERSSKMANAPRPTSVDTYVEFLGRLQRAVRSNNRRATLDLVALPLRVNYPGGAKTYSDRRSIERDFDRIFSPRVKTAILHQRTDDVFSNSKGAMLGNGEVWIDRSCLNESCSRPGPLVIQSINP